jgi:hypothetical protein
VDLMQGNLFGEAMLSLPWSRKEDLGFAGIVQTDRAPAVVKDAPIPEPAPPVVSPVEITEVPGSAEMEDGLSRLKLAIRALDEQFRRTPAFDQDAQLAEAV